MWTDVTSRVEVEARIERLESHLRDAVTTAVRNYLKELDGQMTTDFYQMVLAEIEAPLLTEIMQRYRNISSGQRDAAAAPDEFVVYSAHDKTLNSLAIALGLTQVAAKWTPFASRLVLELHKYVGRNSTYQHQYFFRVLFNGIDYTRSLQICKPRHIDGVSLCSIDDLDKYLATYPQRSANSTLTSTFVDAFNAGVCYDD